MKYNSNSISKPILRIKASLVPYRVPTVGRELIRSLDKDIPQAGFKTHERSLILLGELEHNYFFNTVCSLGASKQKLLMFPLKQGFMYANYFLFHCASSQYLFDIKAMSIILPQNTNMKAHGSHLTCLLIKSQNACSQ